MRARFRMSWSAVACWVALSSSAAACSAQSSAASSSPGDALRPYVSSLIRFRETEARNAGRRDTTARAAAESLLVDVLALPRPLGDQTLAYLLFLDNVGGEAAAEDLGCTAIERGDAMRGLIETYQKQLPVIGLEPLPSAVVGNGALPRSVVSSIRDKERC